MKNSVKNKLQQQYENRAEMPVPDLWNRIETGLPKEANPASAEQPKRNYWKAAAIVLFLISVGFVVKFFLNQNRVQNNAVISVTEEEQSVPAISDSVQNPSEPENFASEKQNLQQYDNKIQKQNPLLKSEEKQTSENSAEEKYFVQKTPDRTQSVTDSQNVDNLKSVKQNLAENTVPKVQREKTRYVTAEDLLFEREARKSLKEQEHDTRKLGDLGNIKITAPKEVKILGITVYSEEEQP